MTYHIVKKMAHKISSSIENSSFAKPFNFSDFEMYFYLHTSADRVDCQQKNNITFTSVEEKAISKARDKLLQKMVRQKSSASTDGTSASLR